MDSCRILVDKAFVRRGLCTLARLIEESVEAPIAAVAQAQPPKSGLQHCSCAVRELLADPLTESRCPRLRRDRAP